MDPHTTSTTTKPATARPTNGKPERKTPERIPRSDEFAAQAKCLNILQRLPEEKRTRVIRALVGLLGA